MWDELGRLCAIHNKEVGTSPANQKKDELQIAM
jgi:hypothetical protein